MIIDLNNRDVLEEFKRVSRVFPLAITSGCFDLLHRGHVHFLAEAKKQLPADAKLLVITHSDEDIARIKGAGRPVYPLVERLGLLANLRPVDFVCVYSPLEETYKLCYELEPEFLVAGTLQAAQTNWEYNWQRVAKDIEAKLLTVDRDEKFSSTTSYIEKIRQ